MNSPRGFRALLASQFCGAVNDNILKQMLVLMVVVGGLWSGDLGPGGQGIVLACFTLPFIVLSAFAGQVADRWCKRRVTVIVRATEIPIALIAGLGFLLGNLPIALGSVVLLSVQSAFFGPAKYGMIPELVPGERLSRANGAINLLTNAAAIAGTVIAGVVADRFHPRPAGLPAEAPIPSPGGPAVGVRWDEVPAEAANAVGAGAVDALDSFVPLISAAPAAPPAGVWWHDPVAVPPGILWLPGVVMLVVAVAGLVTALPIPPLGARRPDLRIAGDPIRPYVSAARRMADGPLLVIVVVWAFFYLLAGLALLILPEYHLVLDRSRTVASALMGLLGISIGIGSAAAGLISGRHVELRLVPIGAVILLIGFVALGLDSSSTVRVGTWLLVAGIGAGFYIVPLQATIQRLAPPGDRGRFIGTANALSFVFLLLGSLLFAAVRPLFDFDEAPKLFLLCAGILAAGAGAVLIFGRGVARDAWRSVARADAGDAQATARADEPGGDAPATPDA